MVGKKGPRKLLVASVGVATINYALIGCDTFAPADNEAPDSFIGFGGKSSGSFPIVAGTAPIPPTSGNLPSPIGGFGQGGFAGQTFGGAAGGGMGGVNGGMGGANGGMGGVNPADGGESSGGDGAGGDGGADGAGGDAAGGADGAGGVGGAP